MKKQEDEKPADNNTHGDSTVLIVNPSSSSGSTGKNWDDLYTKIKEIFRENPDVVFSKKSGDGTTLAREYLKKGFKNIVAIGGDGTINEVANGFFFFDEESDARGGRTHISTSDDNTGCNTTTITANTTLPTITANTTLPDQPILRQVNPDAVFGIVSSGTRNVLAKSLNLPNGIIESCRHFAAGKPQKIDVIAATVANSSNENSATEKQSRIFLNAAEIGVAAEIIDRSKKIRDKVKSRIVSTVSSMVATIPAYQSNLCEISVNDRQDSISSNSSGGNNNNDNILTKMTMCVVANGKYLGGGLTAAPQATVSDGLLDVVILKNSGSFKMLKEFASMKKNVSDYTNEENDILYMKAKQVSIKLKEEEQGKKKKDVTVTVDGEPIGILPATFRIYQSALTVKI